MKFPKLTALVPIKHESERLPNKNFLKFDEKPLYTIILDKLEKMDAIHRIIVNTDSPEIAETCTTQSSKMTIVNRPAFIQGNEVTMNSIIEHDLLQTDGEHFLQTHVTNPLLTERTIQDALETYFKQLPEYDSLLSVNSIKKRAYNEKIEPINHRNDQLLMTQDLPEILIENSNIFLFSRSSFYANNNSRIGKKPFAYKMNEFEAIDIDTLEEFQLAELIHSRRELFGFID